MSKAHDDSGHVLTLTKLFQNEDDETKEHETELIREGNRRCPQFIFNS